MKRIRRIGRAFLAAAVLFALAGLPCGTIVEGAANANGRATADKLPEREAVEELVRRLVSAWNRGDVESLAGLFAPDGHLAAPRRRVARTRPKIKELIARERRARLEGTTLTQSLERVEFPSTGRAELHGKYAIRGVHLLFGLRTTFEGPFTLRLRKQGNGWEIVRADVRRS